MARIKIGFDIDGVILDYVNRYAQIFRMMGGKYDVINATEFNLYSAIPKEEHTKATLAFGYMMNETLNGHVDFVSMIRFMLLERKQHMYFITARNEELGGDSARMSIRKFIGQIIGDSRVVDNLFTVKCVNGNKISKLDLINKLDLKYFIDDRRKTCLDLSKSGIKIFMPKRPWNYLRKNTTGITQYSDSSEVVKILRGL